MEKYQICNRCVMDNYSDNTISFDENGHCNYCNEILNNKNNIYFPNEIGEQKLQVLINTLKGRGKDKQYDCLMGISGGLDSCYLAYLGVKWGLRILAVHIDDGFDTEIAKQNIRKLCQAGNIELKVIKPDKEQFNDLTRAFILAEVPNIATPQDNVLFAYIYKFAREYNIKYFLSGGNFALESILQQGNTYTVYDVVNIMDIHKKFGRKDISNLPLLSEYQRKKNEYLFGFKSLRPLNLIDYNRDRAFKELNEFCGFEYYGSKHLENTLTKFIQLVWFPKKFGVDKRKSHLSSMIISNQMTRDEALLNLQKPMYNEEEMEKEIEYILKTLDIDKELFNKIISRPGKQHNEYKTSKFELMINYLRKIKKKL